MKVLIVGSGIVAKSVAVFLTDFEVTFSQRHSRFEDSFIDLALPSDQWRVNFSSYDLVLIAAGLSGEAQCSLNPELSNLINFHGTRRLIELAVKSGSKVIFFSTSFISTFEELPNYRKFDFPYSYQKYKIEQFLNKGSREALIIRPGKILSPHEGLIANMVKQLTLGSLLSFHTNYLFSPISARHFGFCVEKLIKQNARGTFTLTSKDRVSYFDFARMWCTFNGFSPDLILPSQYLDEQRESESISKLSGIELSKVGIAQESIEEVILNLLPSN